MIPDSEKLYEKELAKKMSELIRGMSPFKLYQIIGIMKEIVSDHLLVPGNSVHFENLFKISNKEIAKYSINDKETMVRNQLKASFSETIKKKLNE